MRFGTLGTQYFDNSGEPLVNGLIYFYQSGTTTAKDTFSDINETIPNANPVVLTASGRQPNIFFSGSAKAVLATSSGVIIETRDPVGATSADGQFGSWSSAVIYSENDIVEQDGEYFISLQNANQGYDPDISPEFWTNIKFIRIWNADETYNTDDTVRGSDGILYRSTTDTNLNNNPISDITGANWLAAGVKLTTKGSILVGDGTDAKQLAVGPEGTIPKSRAAAPLGIAWEPEATNLRPVIERTSNTILSLGNSGSVIRVTSGTFTQTFDDAVTLGEGWFVRYVNDGTGVITLDPDGAETIDITTVYPGDQLLIVSDGVSHFYAAVTNNNSVDNKIVVTTGNGYGSTNTVIRRFTTTLEDVGTALTYADSATLGGSVTVNEPGLYEVYCTDGGAGSNTDYDVGASINSAQLTTGVRTITAANRILYTTAYNTTGGVGASAGGTRIIRCEAGDVIRAHHGPALPTATAVAETMLSITKVG